MSRISHQRDDWQLRFFANNVSLRANGTGQQAVGEGPRPDHGRFCKVDGLLIKDRIGRWSRTVQRVVDFRRRGWRAQGHLYKRLI